MNIADRVSELPVFQKFGSFRFEHISLNEHRPFNPCFVNLRFFDQLVWVVGNKVWRGVIKLPPLHIVPAKGRKIYRADVSLHAWDSDRPLLSLFVNYEVGRRVKGTWRYLGFPSEAILNEAAFIAEDYY